MEKIPGESSKRIENIAPTNIRGIELLSVLSEEAPKLLERYTLWCEHKDEAESGGFQTGVQLAELVVTPHLGARVYSHHKLFEDFNPTKHESGSAEEYENEVSGYLETNSGKGQTYFSGSSAVTEATAFFRKEVEDYAVRDKESLFYLEKEDGQELGKDVVKQIVEDLDRQIQKD